MAIYKLDTNSIIKLSGTTFAELGLKERQDLQRILKDSIDAIAPDTLVIAEEFGEWTDSQRRIDLLAIDKDANLIVIELKRTVDGGHMDLQAVRYASMISTMTFSRATEVFAAYRGNISQSDAEEELLHFLGWESANEEDFASDVRIVLASAEFSKELTTSVLWLNDKSLDIRCIRMKPYQYLGETLVNIEQVIPLPEAEEFQVSVREKRQKQRQDRASNKDTAKRDLTVNGTSFHRLPKRRIIYEVVRAAVDGGADIEQIRVMMPNSKWATVDGEINSENFIDEMSSIREQEGSAFKPRRFFCDDDNLFQQNGKTYALSNQWGTGTQMHVEKLQKNFELDIKIEW